LKAFNIVTYFVIQKIMTIFFYIFLSFISVILFRSVNI